MQSQQPFSLSLSAFSATLARNGVDISTINLDILNQAAAAAAAAVQSRPSHHASPSLAPNPLPPPPPPRQKQRKPDRGNGTTSTMPSKPKPPSGLPFQAKPKADQTQQPWDSRLKSSSSSLAPPIHRRRSLSTRLIPARALLLPFEARPPAVHMKEEGGAEGDWCAPSGSFHPPLEPLSPSSHDAYSRGPFVPPSRLDGHKLWSETVEEWEAYDQWHMEEAAMTKNLGPRARTSKPYNRWHVEEKEVTTNKGRARARKKREGQAGETEVQKILKEPLGPRKWEMILKRAREAVGKVEAGEHAIRCFEAEGWRGAGREKVRLTAELDRAREASERARAVIRDCIRVTEDTTGFRTLPREAYDAEGEVGEDFIKCGLCSHEECDDDNDIIICDGGCERCFHEKCAERAFGLPPSSINAVNFKEEDIYLCPACDCKADIIDMINDCFSTSYLVDQVRSDQVLVDPNASRGLLSPKARKASAKERNQDDDDDSDPLDLLVNEAEAEAEEDEVGDPEEGGRRRRRSRRVHKPPASDHPADGGGGGGGGGTLMDVELPSEDSEDEDFEAQEDESDASGSGQGEDNGKEEGEEDEEEEGGPSGGVGRRAVEDNGEDDSDEGEDEEEDEEDLILDHKRKRARVDYLALNQAMFGSQNIDEDEDDEGGEWEGDD